METVRPLHRQLFPSRDIETFCLVRNPLEWIESWYRFRSRKALRDPSHPNHRNYTGDLTYERFIEAYVTAGKRPPYAMISRQYDFLRREDGLVGVDRIIPMERMDRVVEFLYQRTGKKVRIKKLNVSPSRRRPFALSETLEAELHNYLETDLKLYETALWRGEALKEDFAELPIDGV